MGGWGNMMGGWGGPGYNAGAYGGGYWWMGLMGMAMQAVFWVAIIALGIYLFRRYGSRIPAGPSRHPDALDILRERYAKGEIEPEEFQRRKKELE